MDASSNGSTAIGKRLLEVEGLTVTFEGRRGSLLSRARKPVHAVIDVDLSVAAGETLGLVGESGSGKSTIGRAILRLVAETGGSITVAGTDVSDFGRDVPRSYRRAVQVVFQDPFGSLNPSMTVGAIIADPLRIHDGLSGQQLKSRVGELLELVGLNAEFAERYPYEFSGGQRQRIAIARALSVQPDLLVLDEPVSALDVSIQSQVINLLEEIQTRTGVAYLFIAHDLAVVRHTSDRIAVMYRGRIVEEGPSDRVCDDPYHPYTKVLLASVPETDPDLQDAQRERRLELATDGSGEPPSGYDPAIGCPFLPRCPVAVAACAESFPQWQPVALGGRVACFAVDAS